MPPSKNMIEVSVAVSKLNRLINDYTQQLIDREGLTDLQYSAGVILIPLLDHEGQTLSDLARNIHMKAPTITVIANRLEKRGLIRRERSTVDRRQVHLFLTKDGKQVAKVLRDIQKTVARAMGNSIDRNETNITKQCLLEAGNNLRSKCT